MSASFQYDFSWYYLFAAFLTFWLILLIVRKSYRNKTEAKEQLFISLSGLAVCVLVEIFAVSNNLWNYVNGNWPIILWPTYMAAIVFGYQLLRLIESFCI